MKILALVGTHSIGDTLCSVPTIRHLSKVYKQNIHVFTYVPEILKNYPYITLSNNYKVADGDMLIETFRLDLFTHSRTDIRQIHSLSSGFQLLESEMDIEFYPDPYIPIEELPKNYIVIHPSKSWTSRTWERERWQELVDKLASHNIPVVVVGKDFQEKGTYMIDKPVLQLDIKHGLDLSNKLDIHQTWHVLNNSKMVITMDSGILHLAGTTDSYIIQLGSSIAPELRAPYRKGRQDYKYSYILGECNIFCASNMKYNIDHNKTHRVMAPAAYCLENPDTVGSKADPDPNIYKCHPTVTQVFTEIIFNYYKFGN